MIQSFFKKLPLLETAALFITLIALTGWLPDNSEWTMSAATAIAFIVCIAAKICIGYTAANTKLLLPAKILSLLTIAIGLFCQILKNSQ